MSKLTNVRVLTFSGMLIALAAILSFCSVPVTNLIEIRFKIIPIAFAGALFGPFVGGAVGGAADIIGYLVKPTGPFMPGFTISTILSGVIYGLILYKKPFSVRRIALAAFLDTLIVGQCLNTLNLMICYGMPLRATFIARIPKEIVTWPVNTALLSVSMKALTEVRRHVVAYFPSDPPKAGA